MTPSTIMHQFLRNLFILVLILPSTSACSCFQAPSIEGALEWSKVVVKVRVIQELNDPNPTPFSDKRYLVQVHKEFKGGCQLEFRDLLIVRTGADDGLCGVPLNVGATYVLSSNALKVDNVDTALVPVFNNREVQGEIRIESCSYNRQWQELDIVSERLRFWRYGRYEKVCMDVSPPTFSTPSVISVVKPLGSTRQAVRPTGP